MNITQTGIAVAIALFLMLFFFVFPGSLFTRNATLQDATASALTTRPQTNTMSIQNPTDLQIQDTVVGAGVAAASGDTVTVHYVGSLTNGKIFDASARHSAEGFTFNLGAGQVIQGWDKGLVGMKEGGKRTLVIPAHLAYGERAIGDAIPANSTLVFEVELVKVQKP
jgi:FKBP-type peptidyl-prolyl cis-trans isomerase